MGLRNHRYHSAKTSWRNKNRGSSGDGGSAQSDGNYGCGALVSISSISSLFLMCVVGAEGFLGLICLMLIIIVLIFLLIMCRHLIDLYREIRAAQLKNRNVVQQLFEVNIDNKKFLLAISTINSYTKSVAIGFNPTIESIFCKNCGEMVPLLDVTCCHCNTIFKDSIKNEQFFDITNRYIKWKVSKASPRGIQE